MPLGDAEGTDPSPPATPASFFANIVRIPPGATPRQVRIAGLKAMLLGAVVRAAGTVLWLAVRSALDVSTSGGYSPSLRVAAVPMAGGYFFFMFGTYRAITGTAPGKEAKGVLASLLRIVLGLVITLAVLAGVFAMLAMAAR